MKDFTLIHPTPVAIYFLIIIGISMFVMHPVFIILSFIGAVCGCAVFGGRRAFKGIKFYIIVFLLTSLINPLVVHRGQTVMFYIGLRAVTVEALLYGFAIAGVLISVLLWFRCMGYILTNDKFMYLFANTLPKTALVITVIMRLVPMFTRQLKTSSSMQKCMGIAGGSGLISRIKTASRVFSANISRSLEEAVETAGSMRARGYGAAKRSSYSLFRFKGSDTVFFAVTAFLSAVVIAGLAAGTAAFSYYPAADVINVDPFSVMVYICYGALLFLPTLLSAAGRLKWRYCVSAI